MLLAYFSQKQNDQPRQNHSRIKMPMETKTIGQSKIAQPYNPILANCQRNVSADKSGFDAQIGNKDKILKDY